MLRDADLPLRIVDQRAFFDFLGPQDEPWLRVLLAEMQRFEGRHARELLGRLGEPLPCATPHFKRRAASRVLWHLWGRERQAAIAPARARAALFGAAAAAADGTRAEVLAATAARLGISPTDLDESLLADVPGERIVRAPDPFPSVAEAALRTNLAMVQAALMRAASLDLRIVGAVRPIVRLAKLRGLLCTIAVPARRSGSPPADEAAPTLQISGPFSLFRHTLVYGRALAELVPHLAWCARFDLTARCALRGRIADIDVASGDPIFAPGDAHRVGAARPRFDSRLEERFARDFARLAPAWDLTREPEPVQTGGTLIFPDFALWPRLRPERRVLVEIVGFWTPAYLTKKMELLASAQTQRFIVCVDDDRACADTDLPGLSVLRFRRRIDAAAVLAEAARLAADRTA